MSNNLIPCHRTRVSAEALLSDVFDKNVFIVLSLCISINLVKCHCILTTTVLDVKLGHPDRWIWLNVCPE